MKITTAIAQLALVPLPICTDRQVMKITFSAFIASALGVVRAQRSVLFATRRGSSLLSCRDGARYSGSALALVLTFAFAFIFSFGFAFTFRWVWSWCSISSFCFAFGILALTSALG